MFNIVNYLYKNSLRGIIDKVLPDYVNEVIREYINAIDYILPELY